ncbi:hypothetical protein [Rhabdochromatium marinum]|uniref:hypothetical protein n=1 Tax=Rhabdochromatium marinum TaxID=48729 RepID=UPI001902CE01|nr:hypothetical protein [Rhabdochromatium marinum]MBK1649995.1 hypothetical protein [Rhabdochromatium marinum]
MTSHGFCHDITPEPDLVASPARNQPAPTGWAMDIGIHNNWLYLARIDYQRETDSSRLQVQACELASGHWQAVLNNHALTPIEDRKGAIADARCQLTWVQTETDQATQLTLEAASPGGCWRLRATSASPLAPLEEITADGTAISPCSDLHDWLATLELEPEIVSRITHTIDCSGQLYLALKDREAGFSLLSADLQSRRLHDHPVLARGAERYLHNAEIFALTTLNDKLFLAAGTPATARTPDSAYFDYQGFELLQVDPSSGDWEILVGVPRPSPAGLKLPLSALGPSLNTRQTGATWRREWQLLHAQAGCLLLATSDEDGLRLWYSYNGIDWQSIATDAFQSLDQIERCQALECGPSTLVLRVETTNFDAQQQTQLFLLHLDQIEPSSQIEPTSNHHIS